jgi:hypothetical protein
LMVGIGFSGPMSSACKVPIIKGLYSKFLSIEEQGYRAIR